MRDAPDPGHSAPPRPEPTGLVVRGRAVEAYTLRSAGGVEMEVMTYGGTVLSLRVPDREGRRADVALGYGTPAEYVRNPAYFGALVGRYANRIRGGRFEFDGRAVRLDQNDGENHLHGGDAGFDRAVWDARPFAGEGERGLVLTHVSPDGDGGYPGALRVEVTYTLTDRNEWAVDYRATTDRPTVVNLTQHTYLNLAGRGTVLGHRLRSPADRYVPVTPDGLPLGPLAPVDGTPFDFREPRALGERIDGDEQTARMGGYDHTLVLPNGARVQEAARLDDPESGRVMTVRTTEPGVQLYTGNHLGGIRGKGADPYQTWSGVALETQHFPDSPNQPAFPSTVLLPGETYRSRTVYAFSVLDA